MEEIKKIYSKTSIVLFSLIGSTILGTLLYTSNLKEIGKKKHIPVLLILSLIYTIGGMYFFKILGISSYYVFLPLNLAGSFVIIFPLWNKQIGSDKNYEKRKSATTLAIVLTIIVLLVLLNVFL